MEAKDRDAVVESYRRLAPEYDQRWSFYIESTMRETLRRIEVRQGESLLDVGCGTAVLLASLTASVPGLKVAGVDLSPDMLSQARERVGESIVLKQAHAESLPFPDESFDVVVSTNAFHYFRNPEIKLGEMARVLRPGGQLVITDWCDDYLACKLCDFWLRIFDRAHFRTYGRRPFFDMIEKAGFTAVRVDRYKINWLWGLMTAVGRKRSA